MISVIIPVKKLTDFLINENLPAMDRQKFRHFEVIVLPNERSTDNKKLLAEYCWLKIIPTGKITRPAEKRDIGAKKAKGDILAFIDDDAYPTPNWLTNAVKIFDKDNPAAVCGPGILPPNATFWEKVFDEVLKTFIGSGEYSYRFVQKTKRLVDDYPSMNFLVRKSLFTELGGFNNDYWPGEDSKLCRDLVYKKKQTIIYDPSVTVYHHRRDQLISFLKQHANYGFHRGAFFAHGDENSRRFSYLVPTFFVLYLFISIFYLLFPTSIFNLPPSIFYSPLIIYFLFIFYLFLHAFIDTRNFIISLTTPFVLFLTHVVYGIMFVKGAFTGLIKKDKIYG